MKAPEELTWGMVVIRHLPDDPERRPYRINACGQDLLSFNRVDLAESWADVVRAVLADAVREACAAAVSEAQPLHLSGCPVSDARLAEIYAHWDRWENRGQLPRMRQDQADLCALVDWQRSALAFFTNGPEGDDLARLLEAACREGAAREREACARIVEAGGDGVDRLETAVALGANAAIASAIRARDSACRSGGRTRQD